MQGILLFLINKRKKIKKIKNNWLNKK